MFKKVTLDNGLRIVIEKIPYVRSASLGIWVGTGSRFEYPKENGVSHFIEHMLFKGTKARSAAEIADSIDSIGGQINAFTGKECTCYYTKTLDTHLDTAVDVLSDMYFNSLMNKKDIDMERKVILEEIGMYEDSPEELVHDIFSETVWNGDPLGFPILGTKETLNKIDKDAIFSYMDRTYTAGNTVISVAGSFDEEELISLLKNKFGSMDGSKYSKTELSKVVFKDEVCVKQKDTEQVHMCLGFDAIEHGNDDMYTLLAINNIFGGGMSSRLFQKIREKKGLVYSIYSYPSSYKNTGLFTIYAGMNSEHLEEVIDLIHKEVDILCSKGITKEELEKSKEQLKGSYILGLESTSSIMNSIGKSELMLGYINTQEDILSKIDDINMEKVNQIIEQIFLNKKYGFTAVGNVDSSFRPSK
jgi:predicted Zn-dependent peptidase